MIERQGRSRSFEYCVTLIVLLCIPSLASGACETPKSTAVKVFLPFDDGELTDNSFVMTGDMNQQGYTSATLRDSDGSDNNPEQCTVPAFEDILRAGDNLWISTHGNVNIVGVEAYGDKTYCETTRYNELVAQGYGSHIGCATAGDPTRYVILVYDTGIAAWCSDNKQIVWGAPHCQDQKVS